MSGFQTPLTVTIHEKTAGDASGSARGAGVQTSFPSLSRYTLESTPHPLQAYIEEAADDEFTRQENHATEGSIILEVAVKDVTPSAPSPVVQEVMPSETTGPAILSHKDSSLYRTSLNNNTSDVQLELKNTVSMQVERLILAEEDVSLPKELSYDYLISPFASLADRVSYLDNIERKNLEILEAMRREEEEVKFKIALAAAQKIGEISARASLAQDAILQPLVPDKPIGLRDCVARKFAFPFHLAAVWEVN